MTTTKKKIVSAKTVKAVATKRASPKMASTAAASVVLPRLTANVTSKPVAKKPASKTKVMAASMILPSAEKTVKMKKPKLVRDSFTIPKAEYGVLDDLKQRAGKLGSVAKKSELIRAGVKALAAMSDLAFLAALKAVPAIKTGRPAKAKTD